MAGKDNREDRWEWLSLVDTDGPFLSKAALKSFYPQGLPKADASVDDVNATFVEEHTRWLRASASASAEVAREARDRWVTVVLRDLLQWREHLNLAPASTLTAHSPNGTVTVAPWATLEGDDTPQALVTVVDRTTNLRATGTDGWSASAVDRMANLLREAGVTIGIVTDGRWWALVSAAKDVTTASGVFDAQLWREERPSRDAFFALASFASIAGGAAEKRLDRVFAESVASAEQITEALGDQVRRAVELVLQSFSDVHLRALAESGESPLPDDPKLVYEGAVSVLMRVVFLLFAEERGLLPEHELYRTAYAIAGARERLANEAQAASAEALDHTFETWHRLLAASNAVFNGTSFEDMRMPAYGGSLFDPARFPWLEATDQQGRLLVRVSDRAMLEVLNAVQIAVVDREARHLSFRELDVEQIGYVYEGLLGYSAAYAPELIVGLDGKPGFEPEIPLRELETIAASATNPADFAKRLLEHLKKTQEHAKPKTANQIAKAYTSTDAERQADARTKLRHTLLGDDETAERLLPFAGLIRNDLREFPYVVPAGGIVMTESPQRANTGTHYTPRSLAEEVVLHALEPLVYSPGPLDTENSDEWVLKSSAEILDLKVADIAAGSGAFLVAAARYLADRLIEAREREGVPIGGEDPRRFAIREVVARCLYGADINGMAVEMCKLSLWLISMDPAKPFSFVDDRVFHGNSLLGVTTEAQLKAQHIYPEKREAKTPLRWFDVDKDLEDAARLRRELASGQVDDADRMRSTRAKRALLAQAKQVTAKLHDIADGIIAAGLLEGGKPGRKLEERYDELADALRDAYPADRAEGDRRRLDAIIEAGLTPTVDTGEARWKPLHWIVEAPDLIHDHGGFDAIIGNPPFLGGKKLSSSVGANVRDLLVSEVAGGRAGNTDLVVFFLLRAALLATEGGEIGIVATNSIAQGDNREVGLDQVENNDWVIHRAIQSRPWPAQSANLEYAALWLGNRQLGPGVRAVADGRPTRRISTLLEPVGRVAGQPHRLGENANRAFIGSNVNGMGFVLSPEVARQMLDEEPTAAAVVKPYVGGADLNASPSGSAARWILDFGDRPIAEIRRDFPRQYAWAKQHLYPYRSSLTRKPRLAEYWWRYESRAENLYRELAGLKETIAMAVVSKTVMPLIVEAGQVFSHKVVVFPSESPAQLALLSSSVHSAWAWQHSSTMRADLNYSPSDVFLTLPQPDSTSLLAKVGADLAIRGAVMERRGFGLTNLYNLVNSPEVRGDADIDLIRSIHVQIDEAVMEAYGWTDIPLDHGFHTYRQMERWTVSPAARVEILDRLLEENHRRAAIEAQANPKKAKRGKSFEESEMPEGALI